MSLIDDLKKELADRIRHDMVPFGKWNENLWMKIAFGDYYGKPPERLPIIHRVVGETVDNVLAKGGWQMTQDSWNGLKNAIDSTDTAETALPDMEEAALTVERRSEDGTSMLTAADARRLTTAERKASWKKGGARTAGKKSVRKKGGAKKRKKNPDDE